jgi:hypothetical protein
MTDLASNAAALPALPASLASKYAAQFPPLTTPISFSGVYLADSNERTIATRWDASRYVKRNGTAFTDRRQAEVDAALVEIARRANAHDALVAALRYIEQMTSEHTTASDCDMNYRARAAIAAAEATAGEAA